MERGETEGERLADFINLLRDDKILWVGEEGDGEMEG